ncbi:MAG TPA: right-handed parallel beta-helix repeat-containing protein [Arachidicoccus sp.]|nr:right-handed parallel beta-helix repeat-containing protein [Arachidicoccus sp.]
MIHCKDKNNYRFKFHSLLILLLILGASPSVKANALPISTWQSAWTGKDSAFMQKPGAAIKEIYVSPKGNDTDFDAGEKSAPFRTIAAALRAAREIRRLNGFNAGKNKAELNGGKGAIRINLEDGVYTPPTTLFVRPEDGGSINSPTIIEAVHPGKATISGGRSVKGWKRLETTIPGMPEAARGHVYVANLPGAEGQFLNFRQFWVDGKKAVRAESVNGGSTGRVMDRILSWDHKDQSCWIPWPGKSGLKLGADGLEYLVGMEMLIHQWWAVAQLRVRSARIRGDSMQLHFYQPESKLQSEHPWPAPWISEKTGNSAFYLTNALAFLDQPGEWYLDRHAQKLYYWPRPGERLSQASTIIPYLTTTLKIEGTEEHKVGYLQFKGLNFQYAGWLRPSEQGHVPLQAGMYLLDAYKLQQPGTPEKAGLENQAWIGRPAAAVSVRNAHHIRFDNCRFEHLASTGLDLIEGTYMDTIHGNLFKDIGGTGIQIGSYGDESFETHLPYNPKDPGKVATDEVIVNNLITDVTNEDWGCVGISAGYVKNILIAHNEISEVSYSGICVGWGWTKLKNAMSGNIIRANKVTHYGKRMYDVGGIYTLSNQPGSLIENNVIDSIYKAPYPHDPDHWFYFYLDEGSAHITIRNNWCPELKTMKNANGPGNKWENNGPQVPDQIKRSAGLEPQYQYLLKEKVTDPHWPIQNLTGNR